VTSSGITEFRRLLAVAVAATLTGASPSFGGGTDGERPAPPSAYASPEWLAAANGTVYATCATGARLAALDAKGLRTWPVVSAAGARVPLNPSGVAADGAGNVYVTAGVQCGELHKYAPDGKLLASAPAGHWPCAPVASADGRFVYVANRFTAKIVEYAADTLSPVRTFAALREPGALALAGGGRKLFAANLLPACAATNDVVAADVTVVDLASGAVAHVRLPNGSTGVRGICASPDGKAVYVTHTMGRYQLPTTQLERGWMNTAALSVFCGETGAWVNTVLLDDVDRGAANPWGVCVTEDGRWLCVGHAGTREMSVIDRTALHARLKAVAEGRDGYGGARSAADVSNDLAFLLPIRRRVTLPGEGPRGFVACGGKVYAALYFADALAACGVGTDGVTVAEVRLGPAPDLAKDRVRRGEMLYNSGTMCYQQWQSCASCHPDGRADGLNWDLLNDGVGNPKQTKSQLYGQFTPPTMVTGIRKDMKTCNRAGLVHIQFVQRPEEDALCIDAYTESLRPVPSPHLVNGKLSAKAQKGEKVYRRANCAACHGGQTKTPDGKPLYTDCRLHDVGLGTGAEAGRRFDTPVLTEVWRTAPYLYDGRARTMREVLTDCNPHDTHGVTQDLSDEEIEGLEEYVLSL